MRCLRVLDCHRIMKYVLVFTHFCFVCDLFYMYRQNRIIRPSSDALCASLQSQERSFHASLLSWVIPSPVHGRKRTAQHGVIANGATAVRRVSRVPFSPARIRTTAIASSKESHADTIVHLADSTCNASSTVATQEDVLAQIGRPAGQMTTGRAGCLSDVTLHALDQKYQVVRNSADCLVGTFRFLMDRHRNQRQFFRLYFTANHYVLSCFEPR